MKNYQLKQFYSFCKVIKNLEDIGGSNAVLIFIDLIVFYIIVELLAYLLYNLLKFLGIQITLLIITLQEDLLESVLSDESAPKSKGSVTSVRDGESISKTNTSLPHSLEAAIHR